MKRMARISLIICIALPWLYSLETVDAAPATEPIFTTDSWQLASGSLKGGIIDKSSPTLADLTGDGVPEVLIGTTAWNGVSPISNLTNHTKATLLVALTRDASSPGGMKKWFAVNTSAPINSAPAVGDIDGDGDAEVVVSVGGDVNDQSGYGGVRAYTHSGGFLWHFDTHDRLDGNGKPDGVFSSPTLCDVDSDGDLEIAFGGWDHRIYLLDHEGNSLWNPHDPPYGEGYYSQDTVWSSPACADLNGDGYKEIVIGADITTGTFLDGQPVTDGGLLYVFDKDGNVLVRRWLPRAIYASPAVGDLDGDGDLEIVSGTSFTRWPGSNPYVYVFKTDLVFDSGINYYNPAKLPYAPGWPKQTNYPGFSSPALADLDGDGDLEVVIGTGEPSANVATVYAWHHNGDLVGGWPVHPKNLYNWDTYIASSPAIADVDGDGELEILFSMMEDVQVYNADGTLQELEQPDVPPGWGRDGLLKIPQWLLPIAGSPAVGDADGDGNVEVWIGGPSADDPGGGHLWRFEDKRLVATQSSEAD